MKITLLSLNCSYSHTSLALPFLHAYCRGIPGLEWEMIEATTKEKPEEIIKRLLASNANLLLTTYYIFNHTELDFVLSRFKRLSPQTLVVGGGPEFLGNNEEILRSCDWLDLVIRGEGEIPLYSLLENNLSVGETAGFCYLKDGSYVDNGMAEEVTELDSIPSPYQHGLINLNKPFIQVETSRGCPNDCGFCTSSISCGVRNYSLDRVRDDLLAIKAAGLTEIRVLDRTFNANITRACALLTMFREEFADMNFHCEFDPAFVTPKLVEELAKMRHGQLHLELGVQTFSQEGYKISGRKSSLERTEQGLKMLCEMENFEVHSDLIAGLPGVSLETLYDDLIKMISFEPDEIQLENLKLLPGTPFDNNENLNGAPFTPYEILFTEWMDFADLTKAQEWSKIVDWYYNRPLLKEVFIKLVGMKKENFRDFHHFLGDKGLFGQPLKPEKAFVNLVNFCRSCKEIWQECGEKLAVAWFASRYSPEHGLFPATPLKNELDESLKVIYGDMEFEECRRTFKYEEDAFKLVVGYSKGHLKSATTKVTIWKY